MPSIAAKTAVTMGLLSTALQGATAHDRFDQASYAPEATTFRLFAPDSVGEAVVRIYADGLGGEPLRAIRMGRVASETYEAEARGDLMGMFYTFDIGLGETPGVFATAVGANGLRAAIVDMRETDPEGWDSEWRGTTAKEPQDRVIYELHHRDFSIDPSSGLENGGKFLALTEPRAIDHLKRLGVNTVHLLPSFDFASVDETRPFEPQYNWGYDPLNYNVPEGSYSTDPYDPKARIREFKLMVKALHEADIDVVLDVVYNHTFDIGGSAFQRTYPDHFYRRTDDGGYSNGSGCGNETASERPWMREYMLKSMAWWMEEYHVDGFRVDLMGVHDAATMDYIAGALKERFGRCFIYGEGWSAGECAYPVQGLATKANAGRMPLVAFFSDELRDALRGPFGDDAQGAFLAGIPGHEESVKFGIAGAIGHPGVDMERVNYSKEAWASEPTQMIAYASCHDDMCLVDRLRASVPGIGMDELMRLDLLAQTAVLTSQGIPFILCGEEMLRDKKGVHNSYASPDGVNRLDWGNLARHPRVFDYYSGLVALRKAHPAFRLGKAEAVRECLEFLPAGEGIVAFRLKGHAGGDEWKDIVVILNANRGARKVPVPRSSYTVVCRGGVVDPGGLGRARGASVRVPGQSALIMHD